MSKHLAARALAMGITASMLGGCFHYVDSTTTPTKVAGPTSAPTSDIASNRVRVTLPSGVVELDDANLVYPALTGKVRASQISGVQLAEGSEYTVDVRTATRVEVRRLNGVATGFIIAGSALGAVVTVVALAFGVLAAGGGGLGVYGAELRRAPRAH